MPDQANLDRLLSNLVALGPRRLVLLAAVAIGTVLAVGLSAYYLSRPQQEALYSKLDRDEVGRIAMVLQDAGIAYDVSADGGTVMVSVGTAGRARMLLAEKGLPRGGGAGYELFDKLGSLGLTSFMQEVTKLRALEGELARTIQLMKGVKAARVHIVLPQRTSFRAERQPPSASVVIRYDLPEEAATAMAIRHLVAAAIPGLQPAKVTVLDTNGRILTGAEEAGAPSAGQMASLEHSVSSRIKDSVRQTLTPYLGLEHFQVSAAVRLNTDRKRSSQVIYDPNSRVERSVQTTRESQTAQNGQSARPTTVQQNLPEQRSGLETSGSTRQSNEESNKREELVNYEISSRTVEQVSEGYQVERLSLSVLVHRARLAQAVPNPKPGDEAAHMQAIDQHVKTLEKIVASAAGIEEARGDVLHIAVVDFARELQQLEPEQPLKLSDVVMRHLGNFLNAGAILVLGAMLIWFGLRPAVNAILPTSNDWASLRAKAASPAIAGGPAAAAAQPELAAPPQMPMLESSFPDEPSRLQPKRSQVQLVERAIATDEAQAANILREWINQSA